MRVRRGAGQRSPIEGEDLAGKLMARGRASGPVVVGDDSRIAWNRKSRSRTWHAVRREEIGAAVGRGLSVVPGREGVVSMHPALPGEVGDLDRATRRRTVLRELEDHTLRRDVVLRVVGVVGIQDPVDPVLRASSRRARRPTVRALVECRYRCFSARCSARYCGDDQDDRCRTHCDDEPLEGTHLPHSVSPFAALNST